jgi:hypothetical protein
MHYGLFITATTKALTAKKNVKRALIGQRYGFSKVSLKENFESCCDLCMNQICFCIDMRCFKIFEQCFDP